MTFLFSVSFLRLLFAVSFALVSGDTETYCLPNCACTDRIVECYLFDCNDEIAISYPSSIILHGKLCEGHRMTLETLGKKVILKNDVCGEIPDCM